MKKLLLTIFLAMTASLCAHAISAQVTKMWVEHNIVRNGVTGISFHCQAKVFDAINRKIFVAASVDSKPGIGVRDTNGSYRLANGVVGGSVYAVPTSSPSYLNDVNIWVPVSELHIPPGTDTDWHVHFAVCTEDPLLNFNAGTILTWSSFISFHVYNNNGAPRNAVYKETFYFDNNDRVEVSEENGKLVFVGYDNNNWSFTFVSDLCAKSSLKGMYYFYQEGKDNKTTWISFLNIGGVSSVSGEINGTDLHHFYSNNESRANENKRKLTALLKKYFQTITPEFP